jgi:uncharacterized protein YndB with AHSA1/START domain
MKKRITLERTYRAPVQDVWDLWTTKEGIESWWGPDGFSVKVHRIDLRPGGEMFYAMTADEPDKVAFMKKAGMPTTTESRLVYQEIVRHERLSYMHDVDFVPGVAAYAVETVVELRPSAQGVRLLLTFDAMHDDEWTSRARMGWENELGKLDTALAARRKQEIPT